jgi:peptide/nickel transport system ATP-binding protein
MTDNLLSIQDLSIAYETKRGKVLAVDRSSIAIERNKLVAIVGESGCGKSTMALSIIGLLPIPPAEISGGTILYKSVNLLALEEKERRQYRGTEIAMIFQEPLTSLNPVYRVGDQIAEAIAIRELRSKNSQIVSEVMQKHHSDSSHGIQSIVSRFGRRRSSESERKQVVEILKLVRIPDPDQVIDRYPFELSGGMQQRVMIAMALSEKPALLIADEPTTALDVTTQAQVLKLMKELMNEVSTSVLLISHDLAVASQVADRIAVMYAGDLVEDAGVYDLFSEPLHPYSQGLLSCIPSGSKDEGVLKPIAGAVPDVNRPPIGCRYAPRCPVSSKMCNERAPRLMETKAGHRVACFLYD